MITKVKETMLKKSIILVLLTFILSGCVERGQNVTPQYTRQSLKSIESNTTAVQPIYVLKCNAKDKPIDTTQNTIAGSFLLAIGIIILL